MELGAEEDHQTLLFIGLDANQSLILRVIQKRAEFLEAVLAPVEPGVRFLDPLGQCVLGGSVVGFEAVLLKHIAQQRDGFLGLGAGFLRQRAALHADHVTAFATRDLDEIGLLQLLNEIRERTGAVGFLVKRGIELQHGRFQKTKLRPNLAALQHAQGAFHQRHGQREIERHALVLPAAIGTWRPLFLSLFRPRFRPLLRPLFLLLQTLLRHAFDQRPGALWALLARLLLLMTLGARPVVDDRFVGDELVAVLLQYRAGERAPADDENAFVVLLQLVDQRDEIAIAADDGECVDVIVRERHFQGVQREVDIGAVLVAARRRISLHHLHGVLGKRARGGFLASPIRVGELGDDFAALLERVEHGGHVELTVQRGLDADFDVVEVDEHRDLQFRFHVQRVLHMGTQRRGPGSPPGSAPRLEDPWAPSGRGFRFRLRDCLQPHA